jgi:hypothetical protein
VSAEIEGLFIAFKAIEKRVKGIRCVCREFGGVGSKMHLPAELISSEFSVMQTACTSSSSEI